MHQRFSYSERRTCVSLQPSLPQFPRPSSSVRVFKNKKMTSNTHTEKDVVHTSLSYRAHHRQYTRVKVLTGREKKNVKSKNTSSNHHTGTHRIQLRPYYDILPYTYIFLLSLKSGHCSSRFLRFFILGMTLHHTYLPSTSSASFRTLTFGHRITIDISAGILCTHIMYKYTHYVSSFSIHFHFLLREKGLK